MIIDIHFSNDPVGSVAHVNITIPSSGSGMEYPCIKQYAFSGQSLWWWTCTQNLKRYRPTVPSHMKVITFDASLEGWGAH